MAPVKQTKKVMGRPRLPDHLLKKERAEPKAKGVFGMGRPKKNQNLGAHLRVPDHLKKPKKEPTGNPIGRPPKPDHLLKRERTVPGAKSPGRPKKRVGGPGRPKKLTK